MKIDYKGRKINYYNVRPVGEVEEYDSLFDVNIEYKHTVCPDARTAIFYKLENDATIDTAMRAVDEDVLGKISDSFDKPEDITIRLYQVGDMPAICIILKDYYSESIDDTIQTFKKIHSGVYPIIESGNNYMMLGYK